MEALKLLAGPTKRMGTSTRAMRSLRSRHSFLTKKYTLDQLNEAALANFVGYEQLHKEIMALPKYGNDETDCDELANDLYEYIAKGIRQKESITAWIII